MALMLLAILLVLAAAHAAPDLVRLRDYGWLRTLLQRWSSGEDGHRARPAWALPLAVLLLAALVQLALRHVLFGLPAFAFAVLALFYAWGPRDLDVDIEAVLKAPDGERRQGAAQALAAERADVRVLLSALPGAAFEAALSRWFGVFFWFLLLGPAGALGYRALQLVARHPAFRVGSDAQGRARMEQLARAADWAPAHLMALTLALVAGFDAVLAAWREFHVAHGRGYFTLDLGFLPAVARAGVDADLADDEAGDAPVGNPLRELADARAMLRRILIAWLAVIALVAISGLVH